MDDLEKQLGAVLKDPQMMGQLMAMAQSLQSQLGEGGSPSQPPSQPAKSPPPSQQPVPDLPDLGMLQKMAGLFRGGSIDQEQQALLKALRPFLSQGRLEKLERAMRAAKLAQMASAGGQGLLPRGR